MYAATIALSANAGVSLTLPGLRVWIDALHKEAEDGFSSVGEELWAYMRSSPDFVSPDIMAYTHCHGDHYSASYTREARKLWPGAKVILPRPDFEDQLLLEGDASVYERAGYTVSFIRTTHGGDACGQVAHYSIWIEGRGVRVFDSGDVTTPTPEIEALLNGREVDIALMPFTWCTLAKGRRSLREVIRPKHLLLTHLPFAEDERFHYRGAVESALPRLDFLPDVRALQNPYQVERIARL